MSPALLAALLLLGWRAVRAGRRERHRVLMLSALGTSALFLVGYFARVALTGIHRFPGTGPLRAAYLAILASHTSLAAAVLPLALRTPWLALRGRLAEHRRIARWTLPVWLYVSATGVAVYVLLYGLAPGTR